MRLISRGQKLKPSTRSKLTHSAKVAQGIYSDPRFKAFREIVLKRAGYRCEHIDPETKQRCPKASPQHRLVADHKIELKDGGDPFDPSNGQCHCIQHNTRKGIQSRIARHHGGRGGQILAQ
jgi:5-methylcytosine-specific restriction enzyme A